MTNITGKIYQMKNADGTENRFPRTVIEAVLGLSSYLQDQFSSLADIYMPIEGIYEALTGQEFVFRKSPNTIKAKSLTIDRIQGKSLVWNQLIYNGNFINTDGWSGGGSVSNGIYTVSWNTQYSNNGIYQSINQLETIVGHKYLIKAWLHNLASSTITYYIGVPYSNNENISKSYSANESAVIQGIYTASLASHADESGNSFKIFVLAGTSPSIEITNICVFDLTLMFGAGNEPTTVEEFEALYPGYHDYSAGKLISNDAKQLETVGRNVWDEEWEFSGGSLRSKNLIPIFPNTTYCFKGTIGSYPDIVFYDAYEQPISGTTIWLTGVSANGEQTFTTPTNAAYCKFLMSNSYGTTYNHDICINLSDTSFNGQYESYRKSTLPLNLDDFWVKDSQGNQVHITGGLKSAGSVYDEIVGNKYIQRIKRVDLGSTNYTLDGGIFFSDAISWMASSSYCVCDFYNAGTPGNTAEAQSGADDTIRCGRDNRFYIKDTSYNSASDLKTAVTGKYIDVIIATPIEYELVEPLIYTMKAGTTEERISPNENGLSAPFCCDMTYSANENNDAGNAQYAATAGRLLNSHKIWGQDFNGSEDINGNLVSNGILQGTQLKSTVPTGTAPLVVSSTTMVANLVAEKASKLLTARTIWGQSFDGGGNISGAISNITTLSASGLATIAGGIALGTSTKAQATKMVWDETNDAWHLQGNLYADGSISAKGAINNNTDYVTQQQYNELISRIEALEG